MAESKKRKRRRMTTAEIDRMRRLRAAGYAVHQIAERLGRHHTVIYRYLSGRAMTRSGRARSVARCPDCGARGDADAPLQRNADDVLRCVACAARWELRKNGRERKFA